MIVCNEAVYCPNCNKPLLQAFRFEENVSWSPNVHWCKRCELRLFSWEIFSITDKPKQILPLNSFQFRGTIEEIEEIPSGVLKEKPLILTEKDFYAFKNFFDTEGIELILQIYEHKTKLEINPPN